MTYRLRGPVAFKRARIVDGRARGTVRVDVGATFEATETEARSIRLRGFDVAVVRVSRKRKKKSEESDG